MIFTIAIIISCLYPLLFLFLIRQLDFFGTGKLSYNVGTLLWGVAAYFLAASINSLFVKLNLITQEQLIRMSAPVVEEILKALILFYLVWRADFNYVVDGAIYGFGVGIGFAIFENFQYIIGQPEIALSIALVRVFSTNLIHATASGLIGSAMAIVRIKRGVQRILFLLASMILAIGLHMRFNVMVNGDTNFIFAIGAGLLGVILITMIIRRGLKIQQSWIAETLGIFDRVTPNEMAVVSRIQTLDDVLAPIARQFGREKALQTEALLHKQAKIGIKRKILEKNQDEKMRVAIEREINQLVAEMNSLRRAVGPYCMLFVRTVYLDFNTKLWDMINQRVVAAGTGQVGGGLWSTLDDRIQESKTQGANHEQ